MKRSYLCLAALALCGWVNAGELPVRFPERGSWGVNIHNPFSERLLKECAPQWVRVDNRWLHSEPQKGVYDFSMLRKLIDFYRERNCNLIVVTDIGDLNPAYKDASLDEIVTSLSDWHAAAVAEFKGTPGIIWEIGNEPEVFTMGGTWNQPENYTRLALAAARKMKAADPAALVGAGSFAWVDRNFIDTALHAGLLMDGTIDYLTFHGYHRTGMQPESGLAADVEWMRNMIRLFSPQDHFVDLIDSERGYGILPDTREKHRDNWRNHTQGESEQAAYLARHFLEEIYLGIEVSIWYKDLFGEDSYSLYPGDENSGLRPMGKAYRNLAHLLPQNPRLLRNDQIALHLTGVPAELPPELSPFLRSYLIRNGSKRSLVVAAWFPVEAFDGKIIDTRTILADGTMEERWRPVTAQDRVTLPVTLHLDLDKESVKSVSRLELLAETPNSLSAEERVLFTPTEMQLGPIALSPTPDIWVIELE